MADAYETGSSNRSAISKGKRVQDYTEKSPGVAKDNPVETSNETGEAKEQIPCSIIVNVGQDVVKAVMTVLEKNHCSGVILSAYGCISQASISNQAYGSVELEGNFDIVLVRGHCDPVNGYKVEVMLAKTGADVVGGMLTGSLIASTPVQVIMLAQVPKA